MSVLSVTLSAAVGAFAGAVARPAVFARSVPAPGLSRNECPHCGTRVTGRRFRLLPASGRCPACAERIGPPAFSVEMTTAAVFAALAAWGAAGNWFAAAQYWLTACGITLALIDLAVQRLPDVLTLPACAARSSCWPEQLWPENPAASAGRPPQPQSSPSSFSSWPPSRAWAWETSNSPPPSARSSAGAVGRASGGGQLPGSSSARCAR